MKLRHCLFLLGLAPALLQAATEFDGGLVPVELVRQFTSGAVYRSLPDGFPVVSLPAGTDVRLLGSMQRGTTRDALLTTQNVPALHQALITAYTTAGWTNFSSAVSASTLLCHNQLGYLVITRPSPTYNGLRMTHSQAVAGQTCDNFNSTNTTAWLNYFFGLMPTLTPPLQTRPPAVIVPFLISMRSARVMSDGGTVTLVHERDIDVPDINIPGLYAHFAARLGEQGWVIDSEDAGLRSATAVAYKVAAPPANETASDTQLTGFLTILRTGETTYRLTFSFEAMTDGDFNLNTSFSVPYNILGNGGPPLNDPQLGIRGIPAGFIAR